MALNPGIFERLLCLRQQKRNALIYFLHLLNNRKGSQVMPQQHSYTSRAELETAFKENQHDIYVQDCRELVELWVAEQRSKGKNLSSCTVMDSFSRWPLRAEHMAGINCLEFRIK